MGEVRQLDRLDELEPLRPAWDRLLKQTPGATFFQSFDWLSALWRHFGREQRFRVLVVFDRGEVEGIVPLVVRCEQSRVGAVRVLTYPLDNWGSFYGPISSEPAATLAAALAWLRRRRRDWDVIELRWVGMPGTNYRIEGDALREAGFQAYRTIWDWTAVVDIQGTWQSYHDSRSRLWRRNLRAARRRLEKQGRLQIVRYRPAGRQAGEDNPRWDLYDACEQVARNSWQAAAPNGTTLCDQSVRQFLRELHQAAAAAGAVDLNLLVLDERPLAFAYNYVSRGYVYGLRVGYDAAAARDGPGALLLAEVVRGCYERGDWLFDMGIGSLEAKRHLMTRQLPIFRYSHYALPPLRTQLLRVRRWLEDSRLSESDLAVGPLSAEVTPM